MAYKISGLQAHPFTSFFGLGEAWLAKQGAVRVKVDSYPGYPDRISLREIPLGETALLINHTYQPAETPYFGTHAIYIWEGCTEQGIYINALPAVMSGRVLSLRAYDKKHFLRRADLCSGEFAEPLIHRFFADPSIDYIHIHNAKQGCFSCLAERLA
ncbi:MAG TPA: DUF1203 domain-containing protein [Pantoea sp.]|uniref:DUF1203 domain-containing protein n=1 Tax=Pantoea TaxID=53335 RepID=UPI000BB5566B|nr:MULTISPECIES: DUF1203 domain-containing protein [Pantoea]PNK70472.1 DUF1203 domain-containing protein [Pantoea sp. FDAARGOS_194]HAK34763.1 DUF1203 domain-containing protein [Pantoea sp.]